MLIFCKFDETTFFRVCLVCRQMLSATGIRSFHISDLHIPLFLNMELHAHVDDLVIHNDNLYWIDTAMVCSV